MIGGVDVDVDTLENLFRLCSLSYLMIGKVIGIDKPAKAVEIVPRLVKACRRNVTINFCSERRVWS